MSISQRFKALCEQIGSQTKLADKAGIHNAVISRIINANTATVRSDTLEAVVRAYPNLNARWLLTGNGKMWLKDDELAAVQEPDYKEQYIEARKQLEKQNQTLERLNQLQEQRLADLERLIRKHAPELAREIGLSND
jgi:transcriptional regulator with XRE-family HTH domain